VRADGPCDLVEAMLAIDDPYYQQMYAGHCGDKQEEPRMVIVHAPPTIFPPDTRCPGRTFRVFHGETDVVDLIPQLDVVPNRDAWRIVVTTVQPNPRETPDGGFEAVETYCAVMSGFVELRDRRWRTFIDRNR
jgi:hypothetical protein